MKTRATFLWIIGLLFITSFSYSQSKVGHINTSDLIKLLPDYKTASTTLQTFSTELQDQIDVLVEEYTKKVESYKTLDPTTSDVVRKDKETEIMQLEDRIKAFQEEAENSALAKQKELMNPILDKVETAIKEVAEEKGYNYILDTSSGIVLYFDESDDITIYVKKKLGVETTTKTEE